MICVEGGKAEEGIRQEGHELEKEIVCERGELQGGGGGDNIQEGGSEQGEQQGGGGGDNIQEGGSEQGEQQGGGGGDNIQEGGSEQGEQQGCGGGSGDNGNGGAHGNGKKKDERAEKRGKRLDIRATLAVNSETMINSIFDDKVELEKKTSIICDLAVERVVCNTKQALYVIWQWRG